jgi:2-dehydropantoate 2-reductase
MRLAIVGAGAIGGWLAGQLIIGGEEVTLVARGATLAAIRERGLSITSSETTFVVHPRMAEEVSAVAAADVVFLAVKAHALTALAPVLGPALGADACVVSLQNGVPWWYFDGVPGPLANARLESVDPGGIIAHHLPPERVVGAVVYPATRVVAPGVVEHIEGRRISIGEPDGSTTERCGQIAAALTQAGVRCPVRADLRGELWLKLVGNAVLNPLSALTRASLAELASDPLVRPLALGAMEEAAAVAASLGVTLRLSMEQRLAAAAKVGDHKTSMLQDLEAGRRLELEPILGAVVEIGKVTCVATPTLDILLACTRLLAQSISGSRPV